MSNTLNTAVTKAIQENLPAQVANEMLEFINEAKKVKTSYDKLQQEYNELNDLCRKLEKLELKRNTLENLRKSLDKREAEVTKREQSLDKRLLEIRLEEANERNIVVERLVNKVFSVPTVTVTNNKSLATGGYETTTEIQTVFKE